LSVYLTGDGRSSSQAMLFREISDIVRIVGNGNGPTLCRQTQSTVFKHLLHVLTTLLQRRT